jgi:CelD/BcsL family acetyltransferase involved in cellulose biosynthesis
MLDHPRRAPSLPDREVDADLRIQRLDALTDARWQAFLDGSPDASIFHHPAWLGLLATRYRFTMSALCVLDGTGAIKAGIPLARVASRLTGTRLVAVPFSDICPPAYAPGAGDAAARALAQALLDERARGGLDVEVRARVDGLDGAHVVDGYLTHRLALVPDADAVLARASKSQVRRAIVKARREGVAAEARTDRDALRIFYELHLHTRRRQGVPIQPKRFILDFEQLFARGLGCVMVSHHEGRTIAAAVFLHYGGTLTYKYGASDERFLGLRPNHALFAEAIRRGCEAGLHELDFGRTDPGNEGLARFKRSWGAEEERLAYTYLADHPPRERTAGLAGRAIGAVIRRGPASTGRVIGTALYRHVG